MTKENAVKKLTKEILCGRRIKREDDLSIFLDAPLEALQEGAHELQRQFCGKHIDLCTIINARSGHCSEDCKYCAQSAHHRTGVEEYAFLAQEEIIANARANEEAGVNRFSIVTSGRALAGKEFDAALDCYRAMRKKLHIDLCASHGILSREQRRRAASFPRSVPRTPTTTASARSVSHRAKASASVRAASSAWARRGKTASTWR